MYTGHEEAPRSIIWRVHGRFNDVFERFRAIYAGYLDVALDHKRLGRRVASRCS